MTQAKPEGTHAGGRRKSENRQRQKLVAVRFSRDEYNVLVLAAVRTGKSQGSLLREAFLRSEEGSRP